MCLNSAYIPRDKSYLCARAMTSWFCSHTQLQLKVLKLVRPCVRVYVVYMVQLMSRKRCWRKERRVWCVCGMILQNGSTLRTTQPPLENSFRESTRALDIMKCHCTAPCQLKSDILQRVDRTIVSLHISVTFRLHSGQVSRPSYQGEALRLLTRTTHRYVLQVVCIAVDRRRLRGDN